MKKKFINILIIMVSLLFIGWNNVFAGDSTNLYKINSYNIPTDTYIIGTYVFTEERTYLSTQDIMWASRSIDSEYKDDMIIYYKDLNGNWVDGITGNPITVPTTFSIDEIDGESLDESYFYLSLVTFNTDENGSESISPDNYYVGDFYQGHGFQIPVEENATGLLEYDLHFTAHNIEDGIYDIRFGCKDTYSNPTDMIQISPQSVNISNSHFTFTTFVNISEKNEYYSCEVELIGKNEETYSIFWNESLYIDVMSRDDIFSGSPMVLVGIPEDKISGAGMIIDDHSFQYMLSKYEIGYGEIYYDNYYDYYDGKIALEYQSSNLADGDYDINYTVYNMLNEEDPVAFGTQSFTVSYNYVDNPIVIDLGKNLQPGSYVIYLSSDNYDFFDDIYVTFKNESNIVPINLISNNDSYGYELDVDFFENFYAKAFKRSVEINLYDNLTYNFNIQYACTGIPDGTYIVRSEINSPLPASSKIFRTNDKIEVKNGLFNVLLTIPLGSYILEDNMLGELHSIRLTFHEIEEYLEETYVDPVQIGETGIVID